METKSPFPCWFRAWVVMACFVMLSCSSGDDEAAIRELIKEGTRLAEGHDLGGLMDLTTGDFMALPGELDHKGTKRILFMAFRHYGNFKVVYPRPDVTLAKDHGSGSATLPFFIVKKEHKFPKLEELYNNPKRWLEEVGEGADLYRLKLDLTKDGGNWRVRRALVERFKGVTFGS